MHRFLAAILFGSVLASGQTGAGADRPFHIQRLDPALDEVIAPDAKLETLGEHFGLTEGPVWVPEGRSGYLLFSHCAANVIYKWSPSAALSVFLEKSGYTGKDTLNVGQQTVSGGRVAILLIGSNGLTLDPQGRRFSGPNDIAAKSDGAVYFTDSVNGLRGGGDSRTRELPFNGFYLVKDGNVTLLGGDKDHPGDFPNGIALSPDEKHLYVTAGFRKTLRYDVLAEAGNDGIKVDRKGNVYPTTQGNAIWITSREGQHLGMLEMPQSTREPRPRIVVTNMAFGDADGKTLYVTACTHLFRIRLKVAGTRPAEKL